MMKRRVCSTQRFPVAWPSPQLTVSTIVSSVGIKNCASSGSGQPLTRRPAELTFRLRKRLCRSSSAEKLCLFDHLQKHFESIPHPRRHSLEKLLSRFGEASPTAPGGGKPHRCS